MKILLLNQFFWPDSAATSQLLTDLARELAKQGHVVTAICGRSRYAKAEASEAPPVKILRVPDLRFARKGPLRLLSYLCFLAGAAVRALLAERADVVVTLTTPPLLSLAGTLVKAARGSRHFIWEMDVYPDIAVDLRVLSARSSLTHALQRAADMARRRADGVIALGECMRERLALRGLPSRRIPVAENWADGREIRPLPQPGGPFTVLYSGNLGLAHEVETVAGAMKLLRNHDGVRFVFAGDGPERKELEEFCRREKILNAEFEPYCQRAELGARLARGHVGLVTQKRETVGSIVPSKVYALMAAGRPVLFVGPQGATPNRIVQRTGCGWQIDCGNAQGLAALVAELAAQPELAAEAGARARLAFEERYDLPAGVGRICDILGARKPAAESVPAVEAGALRAVASRT